MSTITKPSRSMNRNRRHLLKCSQKNPGFEVLMGNHFGLGLKFFIYLINLFRIVYASGDMCRLWCVYVGRGQLSGARFSPTMWVLGI